MTEIIIKMELLFKIFIVKFLSQPPWKSLFDLKLEMRGRK